MRLFLVLIILVGCQQTPGNNSESKSTSIDSNQASNKDTITSNSDTLKNTLPPPPPPELRTLEFVAPRKEGIEENYPDEILPPIMDNRITESVPNDDIRAEAIEGPVESDKVYDMVDEMLEFLPKGQLANFIEDNLVYPENTKEEGSEGAVMISFIVEKDGRVTNASILKSSNVAEFDMEAIRVVKKMPRFAPGKINGKAVRCRMKLPITIYLEDK
jgi:protein TonB